MRKIAIGVILVLLLTGCSAGEPVELKMPYNVETAAQQVTGKLKTEIKNSKTEIEVAEAVVESRNIEIADAVIATPAPTPTPPTETPTPEPETPTDAILTPLEPIQEPEPEPVVELRQSCDEVAIGCDPEPAEELPTPADEFAYYDQSFLGTYTVTWYSREAVGYDAEGASGNGLVPYYSCAMPDYSLLNCTVLVEGYGFFHVDDISPAGIVDLYVASNADIPGYGQGAANVYIVG